MRSITNTSAIWSLSVLRNICYFSHFFAHTICCKQGFCQLVMFTSHAIQCRTVHCNGEKAIISTQMRLLSHFSFTVLFLKLIQSPSNFHLYRRPPSTPSNSTGQVFQTILFFKAAARRFAVLFFKAAGLLRTFAVAGLFIFFSKEACLLRTFGLSELFIFGIVCFFVKAMASEDGCA